MILDFSKPIDYTSFQPSEDWQKSIFMFLEEWNNDTNYIVAQTSGSTGKPKTIHLQKKHVKASAIATLSFFKLKQNQTALLCLPTQYIAGKMMVVRAVIGKLKLYCVEPQSTVSIHENIDFSAMTPMQAQKSLPEIEKIKTLIIGGAPISTQLLTKLHLLSTQVFETYGMTETISHIALKNINKSNYFELLPTVKISTDSRNCLQIQAPQITTQTIITNDVVEIKNNSFIWKGRLDNAINSGGVKLQPESIEAKLKPYFCSQIMIGSIPDSVLGNALVLCVEGKKSDLNLIDIFKNAKLSKYETPKKIFYSPAFVTTPNGKLKRAETMKKITKK